MDSVPPWFRRRFDFNFPAELAPTVCIRLRGTPARLEELLNSTAPELLTRSQDGKWTVQEHAGHLLDMESLWTARIEDFLSDRDVLSAADLTNRNTFEAHHNQSQLDNILGGFRRARLSLLQRISAVDATAFSRTLLHPRLQTPMRLVDHLYFVAEHDDHHLASIWEATKVGPV